MANNALPKGFAYRWDPTKAGTDNQVAFTRSVIENFKQLQTHINGYLVAKTPDGETVVIDKAQVTGDLTLASAPIYALGPEHSHMYIDAQQNLTGGGWEQIEVNAVLGSSGTVMSEDVTTFKISVSGPGIYTVTGQVVLTTVEHGYLRVNYDGTEKLRDSFYNRLGGQVHGVVAVSDVDGGDFTLEIYSDTAAVAELGSNNTFLQVTRLMGNE